MMGEILEENNRDIDKLEMEDICAGVEQRRASGKVTKGKDM